MWPSPSSWAAASDSELSSDIQRSGNQNKSNSVKKLIAKLCINKHSEIYFNVFPAYYRHYRFIPCSLFCS